MPPTNLHAARAWYFSSLALFTIPVGMHAVLFPWFVVMHLDEPAARVGAAQMASTLPALALVLLGGLLADRFDQRRMLALLHALAALPPLSLGLLHQFGELTYVTLLAYALCFGAINALAQPPRDALLSTVAGGSVQRTVTLAVGAQFAVQLVGFWLASATDVIGPAPLLFIQAAIVAAGLATVLQMPPATREAQLSPSMLTGIGEAWHLVWRSPRMLPALITVSGVGLFFGGTYTVLIPLYLREVYAADASSLAIAFAAFMAGTLLSIFALVYAGGVRHSGRWLMSAIAGGSVVMLVLLLPVSLWFFYLTIIVWGIGGGIAMSMSRSIIQESAPETHRARVMSVYQFGSLGSLPLGALLAGFAVEWLGANRAAIVPALGVAVLVGLLSLRTSLWRIEALPGGAPDE
jgi:MFS family permease